MSPPDDRRLRVATWNIHACKGMDMRMNPDRTLSVIRELDADLIALQEVPTHTRHPGLSALLAGDHGYHSLVETTLPNHADGFGNVLLSRLPLRAHSRLDLACTGREPRCAIEADVAMAGGMQLHVVATHLGLRDRERHEQLVRIEAALAQLDRPFLLMGDFNTWLRTPAGCLSHQQPASEPARPRSFPALAPMLALDHVVAGPGVTLSAIQAVRLPGLRLASDHLPLTASLELHGQTL